MPLYLVYPIMAISAIGVLVSGLIFKRHTWRVLFLVGCIAVFMCMLWVLDIHYDWRRGTMKIIGVFSALALWTASFKIKKTED